MGKCIQPSFSLHLPPLFPNRPHTRRVHDSWTDCNSAPTLIESSTISVPKLDHTHHSFLMVRYCQPYKIWSTVEMSLECGHKKVKVIKIYCLFYVKLISLLTGKATSINCSLRMVFDWKSQMVPSNGWDCFLMLLQKQWKIGKKFNIYVKPIFFCYTPKYWVFSSISVAKQSSRVAEMQFNKCIWGISHLGLPVLLKNNKVCIL